MARILFVACLLLLGAGILSSTPLNATRHPGAVISSAEEPLTEVANKAIIQRTTGPSAQLTNGTVKTTKATPFQPTGPPAVTVKPDQCPVVGFLGGSSHNQPHDRYPPYGPPSKTKFKYRFSSSSSESGSYSKEGFGRHYHYYRDHGVRKRLNPCRAPNCWMDGDCFGGLKCCNVPGCGMKCLRPVPFDHPPGGWGSRTK